MCTYDIICSCRPVQPGLHSAAPLMEEEEEGGGGEGDGAQLISREWLYTKILDASQKKYYGKLCGLVLAGGSGAGKTTFCQQLQQETTYLSSHIRSLAILHHTVLFSFVDFRPRHGYCSGCWGWRLVEMDGLQDRPGSRKHSLLRNKTIASYLCRGRGRGAGGHTTQFLHSLYTQLADCPALQRFKLQPDSAWLREAVDDPDEVSKL